VSAELRLHFPVFLGQIDRGLSSQASEATWGTQVGLDRAADAQLAHARLQRSALHAQEDGGAPRAADAPLCLFQGAQDVLALGFLESEDRGA